MAGRALESRRFEPVRDNRDWQSARASFARGGLPVARFGLGSAIPELQVAAALEDHHDSGLLERAGAQFAQELGGFLTVSARDLKAAGPDILGQDRQGNAQGRLPELVLLIDLCALADQV